MEANEMQPWTGNQRGESLHKLQGFHHDMGGPVVVGAFELQHPLMVLLFLKVTDVDSSMGLLLWATADSSSRARFDRDPGGLVTGAVEDVRPYLAHATAAVAPLPIARGVQNKVLEAMAKPVLATPEAMEGIRADPALRSLIVQGREQAIACALRLLNGPEQGIGELARQSVLRDYTWKENLTSIIQLLEGTHSVNTLGTR